LTTLSLTFLMKKQCQELGDFRWSKSKSYALPCPSCPLRGSCHPASVWSWKMATRSCSGQGTPRSGMRDESIHDCRIL
jgi:hypothetical protein